jgi:hypothetical protein
MPSNLMLLHIDDKWSIEYDPKWNDSPKNICRYGEVMGHFTMDNVHTAMFYALLEERGVT